MHNNHQLYDLKYTPMFVLSEKSNSMQYNLNEKNIMIQTDHPLKIKLVKTFEDNHFIYFLLEYIDGISLRKYIEQKKKRVNEDFNSIVLFYYLY